MESQTNYINTAKTAVVLINLGTPSSSQTKAVRKYLREFLLDKRVIDLPWLLRYLLVNLIIAPFRSKKSAKAYQAIWTAQGSPLLVNSQKLQKKLQIQLDQLQNSNSFDVWLAMRYGKPDMSTVFTQIQQNNYARIIILPLYPQYASASCGSVLEKSLKHLSDFRYFPKICCINEFFSHSSYINSIVNLIKSNIKTTEFEKTNSHLLFSYHGIPKKQLLSNNSNNSSCPCPDNQSCLNNINNQNNKNTDICYRKQCYLTTKLVTDKLGLNTHQYSTSFQSRLGRLPWIKPYTDDTLKTLRAKNITHLYIISPSFVADCLETLEELGIALKEQWLAMGGESFTLIPCLNDDDIWVNTLAKIILENSS